MLRTPPRPLAVLEKPIRNHLPELATLQEDTDLESAEWLLSIKAEVLPIAGQLDSSQTVAPGALVPAIESSMGLMGQISNGGEPQERPTSSPCPSSSSSSSSDPSSSSDSSASANSSDSSGSSSDSDNDPPTPAKNNSNSNGGHGGGGDKKKDDDGDEDDGNSSDSSSSSDGSADESDQEEDDGVMLDTDDEKDKIKSNGGSPMDEDDESDGSSDLENAYPRLPSAPVDTLIAFRRRAAQEELQLSSDLKKEVVAEARQRQQERRDQVRRASRKKKSPQPPKRRDSKRDVFATNGAAQRYLNGSTGTADPKAFGGISQQQAMAEDEWMVDCSCGLKEKNYDDGTSMIQCDSCSHWVHAKCADKQPETVAQEKFLCFRCSWMFDCMCEVRRRPNHDDGQRMVECETCQTWQHTLCVGIPMTEDPPDEYRCPRCVKKGRRKSVSKASPSQQRQRKLSNADSSRQRRRSKDTSPMLTVDVRVRRRSSATSSSHSSARRDDKARHPAQTEKKVAVMAGSPPPPVPSASPPSTPPPPPSSPPPPSVAPAHALPGASKHDRGHLRRQSARSGERSSPLKSPSQRKRGRSVDGGSSMSQRTQSHSAADDVEPTAPTPTNVTPPSRGKGLMLRGFSASPSGTNASSSASKVVRPQLPLTPPSSGDYSLSSPSNNSRNRSSRKRKGSARDRLAKKLKIKKSGRR